MQVFIFLTNATRNARRKSITACGCDVTIHQQRHNQVQLRYFAPNYLRKYDQVYFKYFQYVLFPNYPSCTTRPNLKVSFDPNNGYQKLFYVFLSELPDMQM